MKINQPTYTENLTSSLGDRDRSRNPELGAELSGGRGQHRRHPVGDRDARRSQLRTVEGGTLSVAAIGRCPLPLALASGAAPRSVRSRRDRGAGFSYPSLLGGLSEFRGP